MECTNEELARWVVDAFNERNLDAFGQLVTDDFEWVTPTAVRGDARTYCGRDGLRTFFDDANVWESIEARVDVIRELGDRALLLGDLSWRDRRGGLLEVAGPFCSVFRFEAGKVSRIETYRQPSEALAAACDHARLVFA